MDGSTVPGEPEDETTYGPAFATPLDASAATTTAIETTTRARRTRQMLLDVPAVANIASSFGLSTARCNRLPSRSHQQPHMSFAWPTLVLFGSRQTAGERKARGAAQ